MRAFWTLTRKSWQTRDGVAVTGVTSVATTVPKMAFTVAVRPALASDIVGVTTTIPPLESTQAITPRQTKYSPKTRRTAMQTINQPGGEDWREYILSWRHSAWCNQAFGICFSRPPCVIASLTSPMALVTSISRGQAGVQL